MRLRVLVSGLAALGAAVLLATVPVLAHGTSRSQPACTIHGTPGTDAINGTQGPDVICTGRGADVIFGAGGADVIRAGEGRRRRPGQQRLRHGGGRAGARRLLRVGRNARPDQGWHRVPRRDVGIDVVHGVESYD